MPMIILYFVQICWLDGIIHLYETPRETINNHSKWRGFPTVTRVSLPKVITQICRAIWHKNRSPDLWSLWSWFSTTRLSAGFGTKMRNTNYKNTTIRFKQGWPISPTLFGLYINELKNWISNPTGCCRWLPVLRGSFKKKLCGHHCLSAHLSAWSWQQNQCCLKDNQY